MADEFDVEAMLEAPYRKEEAGKNDKSSSSSRKEKNSVRRHASALGRADQ